MTQAEPSTEPSVEQPSAYVRRLPIGQRIPFPADGIPNWDIFPFEGDLQVKVLDPPVLPEPLRTGEAGPAECHGCRDPFTRAIWSDEHWRVNHLGEPMSLPAAVLLCPMGHYDLSDLPPERSAEVGPMLQRVRTGHHVPRRHRPRARQQVGRRRGAPAPVADRPPRRHAPAARYLPADLGRPATARTR